MPSAFYQTFYSVGKTKIYTCTNLVKYIDIVRIYIDICCPSGSLVLSTVPIYCDVITEGLVDTAQSMTDLTQELDSVERRVDRAQGKIIKIVIIMLLLKRRISRLWQREWLLCSF